MIPKIIHYCWFGTKELPEECQKIINDWKIYCPNWEIKLWNEQSFNLSAHPFTLSAYEQKKYAFVSDYVRAWALYEYGGIYLDTDVELKAPLDPFLKCQAFSGFESTGYPFTAVWGAIPNHSLSRKVLAYYTERYYEKNQETNTISVSRLIINDFGINPKDDSYQQGYDGQYTIDIYPSTHFCLDLPVNYATHHFFGSWVENQTKTAKNYLNDQFQIKQLNQHPDCVNSKDYLRALSKVLTIKSIWYLIRQFIKNKE
ncbi:glycosyl transferase [Acinetobacter sp. ANC 4654]|uniref:glycosyltransferase family 32 protein n=1 Tax=Acinetobacter sp. ANC 4654 TaxID=1977872 RepID=UPI000A358FBC|nr:glycosyltransferase [Acinetobacter sp. ANC 4654]OTG93968.1 glycosyl transferase [Acinetobacter sp. ANC 4654]